MGEETKFNYFVSFVVNGGVMPRFGSSQILWEKEIDTWADINDVRKLLSTRAGADKHELQIINWKRIQ